MSNDLLNQLIAQVDSEVAIPKTKKKLDYILIDGSGSMSGRWRDALDAVDHYVTGLKTHNVDTQVKVATFSGSSYHSEAQIEYSMVRDSKAQSCALIVPKPPICPGGDTPLFDAINIMVREMRNENPDDGNLVIITDGDENGSRTTSEAQARELLEWCRRRGWGVTFIGCDFNNYSVAKRLGGKADTAIGAPTKRLTHIADELAKKRHFHSTFGTPMQFSDDEKKKFGGYLTHDSNGNGK